MQPNWKKKKVKLGKDDYDTLRLEVFDRQGWRCAHCGEIRPLTLDHIVKRSQGGGDEPGNLQGLCSACHDYLDNQGGKSKEKLNAKL